MKKYFKSFWNESTGDELTNDWGNSTYYFESDKELNVLRQIQVFKNGKVLKYDKINNEDEYGFLTDQPLDIEELENCEVTEEQFNHIFFS